MALQIAGQTVRGVLGSYTSGSPATLSTDQFGAALVSELNARFASLALSGNIYTTGMQLTSISAATFTTADALSATLATAALTTPIIGLWNPQTSSVNLVVLQANLAAVMTAIAATGCGGFVWVGYSQQAAITVASQAAPVNRRTFQPTGSQAKGLSGLALTGLTSTGQLLGASSLNGGSNQNVTETGTAVGFLPSAPSGNVENIDGSIIIPPGGILALVCSTTPVAHSAAASIIWAELPV